MYAEHIFSGVIIGLQKAERKKELLAAVPQTMQIEFPVRVDGILVDDPPSGLGGVPDVGESVLFRSHIHIRKNLAGLRHHSSPRAMKLCHSTRLMSGKSV